MNIFYAVNSGSIEIVASSLFNVQDRMISLFMISNIFYLTAKGNVCQAQEATSWEINKILNIHIPSSIFDIFVLYVKHSTLVSVGFLILFF